MVSDTGMAGAMCFDQLSRVEFLSACLARRASTSPKGCTADKKYNRIYTTGWVEQLAAGTATLAPEALALL